MSPPLGPASTLYLVDGYALIYRAFFAMIARPLTTRRGENTSAAWGVTNFLLRLLERRRPDYLAWVHDVGESFRHQTYPQYKATRQKLTEELQQEFNRSVERIEQILEAFRVPLVGVEGYEADDVIGTLATAARGLQVVIVSGDKDFYQLIGPGIALLNPGRGGPAGVEEHWVDLTNASERLGVPPERVVDYLALVGDSSDNVPGVKGVGEKTALELLKTFGDLDAILANADRIPGKRAREAVLQYADLARLSRELVTIRLDVPLPLDLDRLRVRSPDAGRLTELFTELEFRSLIPKLSSLELAAASAAPAPQRAPVVTGPPSLATLTPEALAPVRELLGDRRVPKAGHDVKYDWLVLRRAGVELAGASFDSMLASFVLDPGRRSHALDDLARERLSLAVRTYAELVGRGKAERPFARVPVADAARYCAVDSEIVLRLHDALRPELEDHQLVRLLETIEMPLMPVLVDMESRGVCIDLTRLGEISRAFAGELTALERAIYHTEGNY